MKFYFTYGTEGIFRGGWTEVEAENYSTAMDIFYNAHNSNNYCTCYNEEQWANTSMSKSGTNLGHGCHEVLKEA